MTTEQSIQNPTLYPKPALKLYWHYFRDPKERLWARLGVDAEAALEELKRYAAKNPKSFPPSPTFTRALDVEEEYRTKGDPYVARRPTSQLPPIIPTSVEQSTDTP